MNGLGGLAPLLERDSIENIHIHGCDHVLVECADGTTARWPHPVASSDEQLLELLPKLVVADEKVIADVEAGVSVQEAFKRHRS